MDSLSERASGGKIKGRKSNKEISSRPTAFVPIDRIARFTSEKGAKFKGSSLI
jgi:hypothetical protein